MSGMVKALPVQEAYEDLLRRSLSRIPCDLGRLLYLASTRDYNTGNYHHDGLADRYSVKVARSALEIAHRQAFYKVAALSLRDLVRDLAAYLESSRENPEEFLRSWQRLEPYRIAIPMEVNPTVARLFASNVRLALAVLRLRREPSQLDR
jgi:hypothetical protein